MVSLGGWCMRSQSRKTADLLIGVFKMKTTISLTLIICLAGSALPAVAQEPIGPGPIARSIAREASLFAADQQNQSGGTEWSQVRNLAPGTEVLVTVKNSQPDKRSVVGADELGLTVLNLTGPTLPAQTIARDDVIEIRQLVRTGGSVVRTALWATLGYFAGGMAGGLAGGAVSAGFGGEDGDFLGGMFVGMVVGAPIGIVWGGIHGYHKTGHKAGDVVYRAP